MSQQSGTSVAPWVRTSVALGERLRWMAGVVECVALAGGIRHEMHARRLDLVATRLRALVAVVREFDRGDGEWLAAVFTEARRLRGEIETCVRFRACEDPFAKEDLGLVATELGSVAEDAVRLLGEMADASPRRVRGGAA